jgi:transposase
MPRISKKTITGRRERQQHRRNQAATLFAQGMTRSEVAKKLKVTWRAAHEWFKAWKAGGESALETKGKPGPRPKVTEAAQMEQLRQLLLLGPVAHGYDNDLWTILRISRLIKQKLGLKLSKTGVWRLLQRMQWSVQMPQKKARERNEEKITQWKEETFPTIAEQAKAEGRTVVFVDESGLGVRW